MPEDDLNGRFSSADAFSSMNGLDLLLKAVPLVTFRVEVTQECAVEMVIGESEVGPHCSFDCPQ